MEHVILSTPWGKILSPKLYLHQNELLRFISENDRVIVHKTRQEGVSTAIIFYLFWHAISNPEASIAFIGTNSTPYEWENFRHIIQDCKGKNKLFKITTINRDKIEFDNGSRIIFRSGSSDALRGENFNLIHISELNYIKNKVKFLQAMWPMMCLQNSKLIITTDELVTKDRYFPNSKGVEEYFCNAYNGKREVLVEKKYKSFQYQ